MIWHNKHSGKRQEVQGEGLDAAELHLASAGSGTDQTVPWDKDATCTNEQLDCALKYRDLNA